MSFRAETATNRRMYGRCQSTGLSRTLRKRQHPFDEAERGVESVAAISGDEDAYGWEPCAKCCLKLRAVTDLGQPEATYHAMLVQAVLLLPSRPPALARSVGACRQRLSCQVSSDKTAEAGIEVVVGELHLEQSLTNWKRGPAV